MTLVAAAAVTAGASFVEKAAFVGLDYSNHLVGGGEALTELGQDALEGVASVATAGLGQYLGTLSAGVTDAQGVIDSTLETGATDIVGNVAQSAIASISYSNGQLGFDTSQFAQSAFGSQAVAGYLGGMAGAATSGMLAGNLRGFLQVNQQQVLAVSNLAGNLVDAGLQYGTTGETTLNVLNVADLTQNNQESVGLLQLSLGSQGTSLSLGSGGIDASVGMIGQAIQGMGTFVEQQKIRLYNAEGKVNYAAGYSGMEDAGVAMRELYSSDQPKAEQELAEMLSGQTQLDVGALPNGAQGFTSLNTNEYGDPTGGKTVYLASLGTAGDSATAIASQLFAGIVLDQEAYRSGMTAPTTAQGVAETTAAVYGHTQLALAIMQDPTYKIAVAPLLAYNGNNLLNDVNAYHAAQQAQAENGTGAASFAAYAQSNYNTTGEFWAKSSTTSINGQPAYYTAVEGDTFASLAAKLYGPTATAAEVIAIENANPQISSPENIPIGANVVVPSSISGSTATTAASPASTNVVVEAEQDLSNLFTAAAANPAGTSAGLALTVSWTAAAGLPGTLAGLAVTAAAPAINPQVTAAVKATISGLNTVVNFAENLFGQGKTPTNTITLQSPNGNSSVTVDKLNFSNPDFSPVTTNPNFTPVTTSGGLTNLPSQDNPVFPNLVTTDGCTALCVMAVPAALKGVKLSSSQVQDIWNKAIVQPARRPNGTMGTVVDPVTGFVNDLNSLAIISEKVIGISNFGVQFAGAAPKGGVLVGYLGTVANAKHYSIFGVNESLFYNPGFTTGALGDQMQIYAYAK